MNITKRAKIAAGALALAGAVTLTGSAFTAGGLTSHAGESQFLGGTVSQTVTGATLNRIDYLTDSSGTSVAGVELTFASSVLGRDVHITVDQDSGAPVDADCSAKVTSADGDPVVYSSTVQKCTFSADDVTGIHVTVDTDNPDA
jgi:hypothetical protein